jgi:hypothetical protein
MLVLSEPTLEKKKNKNFYKFYIEESFFFEKQLIAHGDVNVCKICKHQETFQQLLIILFEVEITTCCLWKASNLKLIIVCIYINADMVHFVGSESYLKILSDLWFC